MSVKAKNIQTWIKVSKHYTAEEREAIANELIKEIVKRTAKGIDETGSSFPKYSKQYMKSLDFNNAGKGRTVNLQLSGDMLAAIKLLDSERGRIKIGYDTGDSEAGRAEGNQIGSYGQSSGDSNKARPFIGFKGEEFERIKKFISKRFPLDDEEKRKRSVEDSIVSDNAAADTVDELFGGDDGE